MVLALPLQLEFDLNIDVFSGLIQVTALSEQDLQAIRELTPQLLERGMPPDVLQLSVGPLSQPSTNVFAGLRLDIPTEGTARAGSPLRIPRAGKAQPPRRIAETPRRILGRHSPSNKATCPAIRMSSGTHPRIYMTSHGPRMVHLVIELSLRQWVAPTRP